MIRTPANKSPADVAARDDLTRGEDRFGAAIVTLGCPTNQVDSERIMSGLVARGIDIVPEENADILIVNTCAFIEPAVEESLDVIASLAELKESGRARALVVAGCLAERYRAELEAELDDVDLVIGLAGRDTIADRCVELITGGVLSPETYARVVTGPPNTAYLRIAEGCDNRCTYCTIPAIRGPFRSVPLDTVVGEAAELAGLGVRELVCIGQDTTRYGQDLDGDISLPLLLEALSGIGGIDWVRLLYAHPEHVTGELIDVMASNGRILPYLDLPFQHVSPQVLKRMGRTMGPDESYELIDRLRSRIDGLAVRTTLMVGFPGETEEDFRQLMEFVETVRFDRLGAFVYSPEEGTPAARMDNPVSRETALERCDILMRRQAEITEAKHRELVGTTVTAIIDEYDPDESRLRGRTYRDAPDIDGNVIAAGSVHNESAFCRVRITGADAYDLYGDIVDD